MTIFGSKQSTSTEQDAFHAACIRIAARHTSYSWPVKLWLRQRFNRQFPPPPFAARTALSIAATQNAIQGIERHREALQ